MKYLVLLLLLVGCSDTKITMDGIFRAPKFAVGDCVDSTVSEHLGIKNEFGTREHHYRKILKVGRYNYLYQYGRNVISESDIKGFDEFNERVDCKTAGF